ncbi:MAG: HEAT repeat domain-containing protein [Chloroflexota bacterium]|nr:HEAT repeat domain-containing protein [Chloroflexota bacterium]
MISERPEKKQPRPTPGSAENSYVSMHGENIRAALALLLGPETDYATRVRATRRLARRGPVLLPVVLTTLSTYPEITTPAWPWWPPQYEHSSRLLLYLSQQAQLQLEDLLHHAAVPQPAGPVLWTSVIEAASLVPHMDHEDLLCRGLATAWATVRYAAAMALATKANKVPLRRSTLARLYEHLENEAVQVRLTIAYALLSSGEGKGLSTLLQFASPGEPEEVRKAALFILATETSLRLSLTQREELARHLLPLLQDPNIELALYAAHSLSRNASTQMLPALGKLLDCVDVQGQIVVLTTLEEMARQAPLRQAMRHLALPARILHFLRSEVAEVRRQACYTLAACGGEYVMAVLGTIVLNKEHPGYVEVIDSLRLLHGVLRAPARINVVHWLLQVLRQEQEDIQVTALDSLAYLLWQARTRGQRRAWGDISYAIVRDEIILQLLSSDSAWVRQRATELLGMLGEQFDAQPDLQTRLLYLLYKDNDSGVRACAAYVCGQLGARWAIPGLLHTLLDADEHVAKTALHALEQVATADNSIVLYVLKELIHLSQPGLDPPHPLTQEGQALLKKWGYGKDGEERLQSARRKLIL